VERESTMEMHAARTQEAPYQEITVHEAVVRLTWLLDGACAEFLGAQRAVDECVTKHVLSDEQTHSLQKLDSATQTIEAVTMVLRNLMSLADAGKTAPVDVAGLYNGVKLGKVVRVLRGECAPEMTNHSGEIDMF
jgi:hypothetical protein